MPVTFLKFANLLSYCICDLDELLTFLFDTPLIYVAIFIVC